MKLAENSPAENGQTVIVVGGGLSGLAAAHRVHELAPNLRVRVLEASSRAGGVLHTVHRDGFLIEQSADNFITNIPAAVSLCRRLGLADELISTQTEQRGALVVRRGKLVRVPAGFTLLAPARLWPLVTTPLLSPLGKLRLLAEPLVPRRRDNADESLASFARRRLGRETFERIVQPLVGGIYTADPEKLSLAATLPRFVEMEQRWGSLTRGMRAGGGAADSREESGARYGLFATLRNGLETLVTRLVERLPADALQLNSAVEAIEQDPSGPWRVRQSDGQTHLAHRLILATSAPTTARLLRQVSPGAAAGLSEIEYAGSTIVTLGYRRAQIGVPLAGFGFVVPAIERRRILAASFSSVKFAGRAPAGCELIRVFLGGACQSAMNDLSDEETRQIARQELAELLHIDGPPLFADVVRWRGAMPQYHLGHIARVAAIERAVRQCPGLELAGNAFHGVGLPHCIQSGEQAAERIAARLHDADS